MIRHRTLWQSQDGTSPHEPHVVQDINNLLNSGEVPGMFGLEDKERLAASMRDRVEVGEQAASKVRHCFGVTRDRSVLQHHSNHVLPLD